MLFNLKNNQQKQFLLLIILGIIFFFIYSFLIFDNSSSRFTWPDETANHFFINNYIENSNFTAAEPLNEIAGNLIKPRSFNIHEGNLVPGSFLGMLLIYGLVGKIVGIFLIKFLTPLLAVLAGLFFYKILLKIFKPNIAFISALLFFLNPAWWYYANFSMLPNIAFLSFLIIGIFYLLKVNKDIKQNNYFYLILGSFFASLSLIIRTNEVLWILGILILLVLIYHKKIKWHYLVISIAVMVLVFLPVIYYNNLTYGSPLSFGYLRISQGSSLAEQLPTEFAATDSGLFNLTKFIVLPFGFSAGSFMSNFNNYYIQLFWWLFIPAVIGLLSLIKNFHKQSKGVLMLIFIGVSLYLTIYYGSWVFEDRMTLLLNKIGISYVRYFLPIYILSLPFVAIFSLHFVDLFKNKNFKIFISSFLIAIILFFNINILYVSGNDNLLKTKKTIAEYNEINKIILENTEANSVIISQRSDKIFFPERKVISRWQVEDIGYLRDMINQGIPLYYYAFEGPDYLDELYYDLDNNNLDFVEYLPINKTESLYQIKPIEYLDYE